jgi:hypothetical protein
VAAGFSGLASFHSFTATLLMRAGALSLANDNSVAACHYSTKGQ